MSNAAFPIQRIPSDIGFDVSISGVDSFAPRVTIVCARQNSVLTLDGALQIKQFAQVLLGREFTNALCKLNPQALDTLPGIESVKSLWVGSTLIQCFDDEFAQLRQCFFAKLNASDLQREIDLLRQL